MKNKIKNHVEVLFLETPKNIKVIELKAEMIQNLYDKYEDTLAKGVSEEDAYQIVISSIGNVDELFVGLKNDSEQDINKQEIKKIALLKAIAISLYVISIIPPILLDMLFDDGILSEIGPVIMLLIAALATGLLVYCSSIKGKRYQRKDETMVEEFKEWKSGKNKNKSLKRAIESALWSVITALYFVISFLTMRWDITWVIFLIGAAIQAIVEAVFISRDKRGG